MALDADLRTYLLTQRRSRTFPEIDGLMATCAFFRCFELRLKVEPVEGLGFFIPGRLFHDDLVAGQAFLGGGLACILVKQNKIVFGCV